MPIRNAKPIEGPYLFDARRDRQDLRRPGVCYPEPPPRELVDAIAALLADPTTKGTVKETKESAERLGWLVSR